MRSDIKLLSDIELKEENVLEEVLVWNILYGAGFISEKEYDEHIQGLFMDFPDNDFLLEKMWAGKSERKGSKSLFDYPYHEIIYDKTFSQSLYLRLQKILSKNRETSEELFEEAFELLRLLPRHIQYRESFSAFFYAKYSFLSEVNYEKSMKGIYVGASKTGLTKDKCYLIMGSDFSALHGIFLRVVHDDGRPCLESAMSFILDDLKDQVGEENMVLLKYDGSRVMTYKEIANLIKEGESIDYVWERYFDDERETREIIDFIIGMRMRKGGLEYYD